MHYNPSLTVMGGHLSRGDDVLLTELRRTVYGRSTALAAREMRIQTSPLADRSGPLEAAFLVADQLFSRDCLGRWIRQGSPVGCPDLSMSVPAA